MRIIAVGAALDTARIVDARPEIETQPMLHAWWDRLRQRPACQTMQKRVDDHIARLTNG
ncbi:hypothetical protein [Salinisphaera sp. Q1T1-3]|uniref:hypothetical protein n=1 Tax=Salinisphaera sp. Q1T1-3 TaxID=2321229 RepID=UPI001F19EE0C|nr:hypothetical protein [Salinisphaera sp. Q1T1-3]